MLLTYSSQLFRGFLSMSVVLICLSFHTVEAESAEEWNSRARNELRIALETEPIKIKPKNIIFFLGDGMGIATLTAARIYKGQRAGQTGEEGSLVFERFPHVGLSKTYCDNTQTTDSAAAATAFLCGIKTNRGVIGVNSNVQSGNFSAASGNEVSSILSWAQGANKATGLVTTTAVTHVFRAMGVARFGPVALRKEQTMKSYRSTTHFPWHRSICLIHKTCSTVQTAQLWPSEAPRQCRQSTYGQADITVTRMDFLRSATFKCASGFKPVRHGTVFIHAANPVTGSLLDELLNRAIVINAIVTVHAVVTMCWFYLLYTAWCFAQPNFGLGQPLDFCDLCIGCLWIIVATSPNYFAMRIYLNLRKVRSVVFAQIRTCHKKTEKENICACDSEGNSKEMVLSVAGHCDNLRLALKCCMGQAAGHLLVSTVLGVLGHLKVQMFGFNFQSFETAVLPAALIAGLGCCLSYVCTTQNCRIYNSLLP